MAFIVETPNPFQPLTDIRKHVHRGGVSIWEWLEVTYPEFEEFSTPTICLVNGQALLRKDWTRVIGAHDVVNFVAIPQGPIALIVVAIVLAVAAIAMALFMSPVMPGNPPGSDPVFSIRGQMNLIRLGEPIEVSYGRNRIYPSYASRPYYQYFDNDQYLFSLFCLGQGQYDISEIQIGDTDIDTYEEVEYEVTEPGNSVTLFPTNVYTAPEVGALTLYGPNEDDYPADGWVGPFAANPAGTDAYQIQIDLVFPKGLYYMSSKGKIKNLSVTIEAQKREIDDSGNPITAWTALLSPTPTTVTGRTTTPQRKTFTADIAVAARYEVRVRRTVETNLSHRVGHDVSWEGLRSYIEAEQNWGDVTLLAVKIRATSNLNDRTQSRFNVIATRELPTYTESDGWSEPVATRSIVWAFADVFRAVYGGRLADAYLDLDALLTLDDLYTLRGDNFDWTFRDATTVWEAARTIARVGRAVPILAGSLVTMKRDSEVSLPSAVFGPENIIKGSFQYVVKLWELEEHDSLQIEYTDPDTGYKQETVLSTLPGGTTDFPRDVRFLGIQDRNQAHREGLYILARERYVRETIIFETGLEGYIPSFGDLIGVMHDVPDWGQSGYVVHAVDSGDDIQLWLSEPVSFEESGQVYVIYLRDRDGSLKGPYAAQPTESDQQIIITPESETIDFFLGGATEPMLFAFGKSGEVTKYVKVVRIEPQGGERVRITSVNDAVEIYGNDSELPDSLPDRTHSIDLLIIDTPSIARLSLAQIDGVGQQVQAVWRAVSVARYFVVQSSYDGIYWEDHGQTTATSMIFDARPGTFYVRVAGVQVYQGAWKQTSLEITVLGELTLLTPWDALEWGVGWWEAINSTGYRVRVYDNMIPSDPVLKRTEDVTDREYEYDYTKALEDGNVVREHLITVNPVYEEGEEEDDVPIEMELSNEGPAAPTGLSSVLITEDSDGVHYQLLWTLPAVDDLLTVRVFVTTAPSSDPTADTPDLDFTASEPSVGLPVETEVIIPLDSNDEHPIYYWHVAVYDCWGEDVYGLSTEQSILAYP